MRAFMRTIPPALIYAVSVALEKGVAIITIPLMAAYIAPDEYGRFDLAVSLVEFVGLVALLGVGPQLIRFASTSETPEGERRVVRELLGTSLVLAVVFGALVQIFVDPVADALLITIDRDALRMLLAAATVAALIELPLVWIRLKDRAWRFMAFVLARTGFQVVFMATALSMGYGAAGVMVSNAVVLLVFATVLVIVQWRETGISFSSARFLEVARYGAPIVAATLAMFALGNANRLFLPGTVTEEEIAYFGLASRLALVTWLLIYPFELWWLPKRIKALSEPGGLGYSAQIWGIGVAIMTFGAMSVMLAGPVFIEVLMPESYEGAIPLIALIVGVQILHQLAQLSNVGAYARETGYAVLAIDLAGAAVAIGGYLLLVPVYGVFGAIIAMVLGHVLRLGAYLVIGQERAPIPYPWVAAVVAIAAACAFAALAPGHENVVGRILWSMLAALLHIGLLMKLKLLPTPEVLLQRLPAGWRHARQQ